MSDEDRYLRYAQFCREQALLVHGPESVRWTHLAEEYVRLADSHRALYIKQQQPKP